VVVATFDPSLSWCGKAIVQLRVNSMCPPAAAATSSVEKLQFCKSCGGRAEVLALAVIRVAALIATADNEAVSADRPIMSHPLAGSSG
jgi:hypothetical protein